MEDTPGRHSPLERKGVSDMADLTVKVLKDLIANIPDNALLTIRQINGGEPETVQVGLVAYTEDNEVIFLAAPDV